LSIEHRLLEATPGEVCAHLDDAALTSSVEAVARLIATAELER
jgi:hypothetical protein